MLTLQNIFIVLFTTTTTRLGMYHNEVIYVSYLAKLFQLSWKSARVGSAQLVSNYGVQPQNGIPDFILHFPLETSYGYLRLGLKEMGKILWEGREKGGKREGQG